MLHQRFENPTMRHIWVLLLSLSLFSCSSDETNRNPFLQEVGFRFELNLNLPLYSNLKNPLNPIYIGNNGVGTRGAFVINTGSGFMAWEASCPNHAPNDCSTMAIDGQNVVCSCEGYTYSLILGQQWDVPNDGKRYYGLLPYRATQNGNIVVISN